MQIETVLLIAEDRSRWEDWALGWCEPNRQLLLVIQGPLESISQLGERVEGYLDRLSVERCRLPEILILPASASTPTHCRRRAWLLARVRHKLAQHSHRILLPKLAVADAEWRPAAW